MEVNSTHRLKRSLLPRIMQSARSRRACSPGRWRAPSTQPDRRAIHASSSRLTPTTTKGGHHRRVPSCSGRVSKGHSFCSGVCGPRTRTCWSARQGPRWAPARTGPHTGTTAPLQRPVSLCPPSGDGGPRDSRHLESKGTLISAHSGQRSGTRPNAFSPRLNGARPQDTCSHGRLGQSLRPGDY